MRENLLNSYHHLQRKLWRKRVFRIFSGSLKSTFMKYMFWRINNVWYHTFINKQSIYFRIALLTPVIGCFSSERKGCAWLFPCFLIAQSVTCESQGEDKATTGYHATKQRTLEQFNSWFWSHFHNFYSWNKMLTTDRIDYLLVSYQLK